MQQDTRAEASGGQNPAQEKSAPLPPAVKVWRPDLIAGVLRGEKPGADLSGVRRLQVPAGMRPEQAVAALLSEAVASGVRVLFLPEREKTAALVKDGLEKSGLLPFCFCAADLSASALREKWDAVQKAAGQNYSEKENACAEEQTKLADWIRILYSRRTSGWPLWEIAARYEAYREAPDGILFSLEEISGLGAKAVNDWNSLLLRLVSAAQAVGHPAGHVLSGIGQTQDSRHLRVHAPQSLVLYREALEQVKQRASVLCASLQQPVPQTKEELICLYTFSTILSDMKELPPSWMGVPDLTGFLRILRELIVHGKRERRLFSSLSKDWLQDLLRQDGAMLAEDWEKACGKWSVSRNMEQKRILKHLAPYARQPITKEAVGPALEMLRDYQAENDAVAKLLPGCRDRLVGLYQGDYTDWSAIERLCALAEACNAKLNAAGCDALFQKSAHVDWKAAQAFAGTWRTFSEMQAGVYRLFRTSDQAAWEGETYLEAQQRACDTWRAGIPALPVWVQWQAVRTEAVQAGLKTVVGAYEAGMAHEAVVPAYEKALFGALMKDALRGEPAAAALSGKPTEKLAAELRKKDIACRELTGKQWYLRTVRRFSEIWARESETAQGKAIEAALSGEEDATEYSAAAASASGLITQLFPCVLAEAGTLPEKLISEDKPFACAIVECTGAEEPEKQDLPGGLADSVLSFCCAAEPEK